MIQIDIQMPENCFDCPACNEYLMCAISVIDKGWGKSDVSEFDQSRPEWCPLKEQEPKTGTWQWKIHGKAESGGTLGEAVCDQCGKSTYATAVKGDLNYCPNCGAKMTEGR